MGQKNHMDNAKANINRSLEPLLQSYVGRVDAADDLMEAAFTLASTYNISAQSKLFYILPELFVSYSPMLGNKEHMLAITLIKEALTGKSVKPKMRAAQLISKYAEVSNLQSRESLAGDGND
eukprot:UN04946